MVEEHHRVLYCWQRHPYTLMDEPKVLINHVDVYPVEVEMVRVNKADLGES